MRKVILLISFIVLTLVVFLCNVVFLAYLSYEKQQSYAAVMSNTSKQSVVYAALPTTQNAVDTEIIQADARTEIIRQFFAKYNSPLEPFAKVVVFYADLYGLDFRIIPSIAMQESKLCLKAPVGSNNCWGFGIYGGKIKTFNSYAEGIHQVTKTLATVYKKSGLDTPEQIMTRYTPSNQGSWANGVNFFMNQLQ